MPGNDTRDLWICRDYDGSIGLFDEDTTWDRHDGVWVGSVGCQCIYIDEQQMERMKINLRPCEKARICSVRLSKAEAGM